MHLPTTSAYFRTELNISGHVFLLRISALCMQSAMLLRQFCPSVTTKCDRQTDRQTEIYRNAVPVSANSFHRLVGV